MKQFDYTIVGGPSHGMKIPHSNGYRTVRTMPQGVAFVDGEIEHVPRRFVIGDNEDVITVFSPPNLSIANIECFFNGGYSDEHMRQFNPWRGHFVS